MTKPLIIAHRGASAREAENTLAAFNLAWQLGADGIEGDYHLTSDRQIVCIHDPVFRYRGKKVVVAENTLAALRQMRPSIPTLQEVIATVPEGKRMVIEVKCGVEIVSLLCQMLRASSLQTEQIMLIAFDASVIHALKQLAPAWRACWLCDFQPVGGSGCRVPSKSLIA